MADGYRRQYGAPPSPQQLDALVDRSITEEMIYREAVQVGLDKDDEIVRRRLIQKYEFLQQDINTPTPPTDAQLVHFYAVHPELYRVPERLTFTHVYFSPDSRGASGARNAAASLSTTLNGGTSTRAAA